jgi:hypothetical protein
MQDFDISHDQLGPIGPESIGAGPIGCGGPAAPGAELIHG